MVRFFERLIRERTVLLGIFNSFAMEAGVCPILYACSIIEAKRRLCDALVLENGITTCPWREQVPAFFVLCERQVAMPDLVQKLYGDSQYYAPGDIGAAAMNMCHQAMELGLGTCILGLNNQEKMSRYFGIPADCKARLVLAVGYSAEKNEAPIKMRMSIDEVCSFNHW